MKRKIGQILSSRNLVFIVLLLEILTIILLVSFAQEYFIDIRFALSGLSILVGILIFNSKCNSSYKITWLLLVVVLPVFGSLCYLLFANKKFTPHEKKKMRPTTKALKAANASWDSGNILKKIDRDKEPDAYFFGKYLNDYSNNGIFANTKVTYFAWGVDAWKDMIVELSKAQHYIYIEYFIIGLGKMWDGILEILKRKVREGVDVRLLYDDLGCMNTLPPHYDRYLNKIGIKTFVVNKFRPFLDARMNNRDHRKIIVIDGHTGYTGGINLADEYIGEKIRFGVWKDNAIKIEGDAVFGLTSLFLSHYATIDKKFGQITDFSPYLPYVYMSEKGHISDTSGFIAPYGSLPFTYETVGENVYIDLILKARKYILITTPYLILDEEMENALLRASKGGVKIKIITPHIPDKKLVFDLTRSYYKKLVNAGIEIYEYTPGFIHEKVFIVDGYISTIGTINLDYRSLFLHMENGCFIYKSKVIKDIEDDFNATLNESRQITKEMVKSSPASKKLLRFFLKMFSAAL